MCSSPTSREEAEIENDFQKKCRKDAKFAAHGISAMLSEISCLFSLALEFFSHLVVVLLHVGGELTQQTDECSRGYR
jgi:hypothetical protein